MTVLNLSGRVAVVTGASRGLGAGLAREFSLRGVRLGLCARSAPDEWIDVPTGEGVVARSVDVADPQAVAAFAREVVEELGQIDLWVNNAGVLEPIKPVRELSSQELFAHLAINVGGVLHGSQAFVHHVRSRPGEGVLINISSGAATKGYACWPAYCAGKAAVDRLTECVQLEEAAQGLRAYSVAPGVIDTHMQELIRACSPEQFPQVGKFLKRKEDEAFNTPPYVAEYLLAISFDPERRPTRVVVGLPPMTAS